MFGEMEAFTAFCEVQLSVDEPPLCTVVGFAEMVHEGRLGGACTVTVVWQVTLWPEALVTVSVYVVVCTILETVWEPLRATGPMPRLMRALTAFCDVHVRVDEPPLCTVVGFAERMHEGRLGGVWTMIVVWHVATLPKNPVTVSVYVVVCVILVTVREPARGTGPMP